MTKMIPRSDDFTYHSRKLKQLENMLKAIATNDPNWNNSWTSPVITVIMKYLPEFYNIDSAIEELQERKKNIEMTKRYFPQ